MPSKLVTPPSVYPVSTDDLVKVHIKVDGSDEDVLLDAYIGAATEAVQNYLNRQLMQATWELQMDNWYLNGFKYSYTCRLGINLPKAPLISVVSVKYDDISNAEQTLDPSNYQVDSTSEPGRIIFTGILPNVYDKPNAIRIRYVAGYGAVSDDITAQALLVPKLAKIGILREVANLYENRQDETVGSTVGSLQKSTEYLLNSLRLFL